MNGFFERVGGFFRRGGGQPAMPEDTDPLRLENGDSAICMAALVIGVLMIVRR